VFAARYELNSWTKFRLNSIFSGLSMYMLGNNIFGGKNCQTHVHEHTSQITDCAPLFTVKGFARRCTKTNNKILRFPQHQAINVGYTVVT